MWWFWNRKLPELTVTHRIDPEQLERIMTILEQLREEVDGLVTEVGDLSGAVTSSIAVLDFIAHKLDDMSDGANAGTKSKIVALRDIVRSRKQDIADAIARDDRPDTPPEPPPAPTPPEPPEG